MAPREAHANGVQLCTCKTKVAVLAFLGFVLPGGPAPFEGNTVFGSTVSPGAIWFFHFPARALFCFVAFFWNFGSEDVLVQPRPKLTSDLCFLMFSSQNAVNSMTWRSPLVNLFPLAFSGHLFRTPLFMPNPLFRSGFMSTTLSHGNHRKTRTLKF